VSNPDKPLWDKDYIDPEDEAQWEQDQEEAAAEAEKEKKELTTK